jgi:hypothetical protein
MKGRLVKWDAAVIGETPPDVENPETHPGCIEIIEMAEGNPPQTIYRRDDHGTDDSGRGTTR